MGLDTVELVIRVEGTFGITILDEDAEKLLTVEDLNRYVLANLGVSGADTSPCLSAKTFYRFRRGLGDRFGIDRRGVRPASSLETLIPESNRKAEWLLLGKSLGWKLPDL